MADFQPFDDLSPVYCEGSRIIVESELNFAFLQRVSDRLNLELEPVGSEQLPAVQEMIDAGRTLRCLDTFGLREVLARLQDVRPQQKDRALILEIKIITRVDTVHGGFLESVENQFIRIPFELPILKLFIISPGEKYGLEAENHHGRHYHYCNYRGRRSDVILTFDLANTISRETPMFWERMVKVRRKEKRKPAHGERKKGVVFTIRLPRISKIFHIRFVGPPTEQITFGR